MLRRTLNGHAVARKAFVEAFIVISPDLSKNYDAFTRKSVVKC